MRLIRFSLVLIGILGLLLAGCAKEEGGEQADSQQGGAEPASQASPGDPTVAVIVDGTEITNGQIDEEMSRLMQQMGGQMSPQQLESMKGVLTQQATDNVINRVLLEKAIEDEGIKADQDEIDEKVINELSEKEVNLKENISKEDNSDKDKPKFTPDEEFRLLQAYFKEMGTEPLLTPKEEIEVSAKIKRCEIKAAQAKIFIESIFKNSRLLLL